MDKKKLAKIPRPVVTKNHQQMLLKAPHMKYLLTAQMEDETLVINFFRANNKTLAPEFRVFCQEDDYITQNLTTDKVKWRTGAVNSLTGVSYYYFHKVYLVMASVNDRKTVTKFLRAFCKKHKVEFKRLGKRYDELTETEVEDLIDGYQNTIKEWKLQAKHQKEMNEIDEQMAKFGDLPDDYSDFEKNVLFDGLNQNYMFYNMKERNAYCTKCEKEFEIRDDKTLWGRKGYPVWNERDKVGHNKWVFCPSCQTYLQCKSDGMSRKGLTSIKWSVLVQKHNEEVLVRYIRHIKDFSGDYRNPKMSRFEGFRTIHSADKVRDFEWNIFKTTNKFRWCNYKEKMYGYYLPSEFSLPRTATLYNTNLAEVIKGTCMQYSVVDIYVDKVLKKRENPAWSIDWYFNGYRKNPYIEQLLKCGFYTIARKVLENKCHLEGGRTILKTLGISKSNFKLLREVYDPEYSNVCILNYGVNLSREEFEILRFVQNGRRTNFYEKYIDMRQYTTIYKLDKYIRKNKVDQFDYFDYIRWLEELGYDMRNEFNLFPKDFVKAHDDKGAEYMAMKDAKMNEQYKEFNDYLMELRENADESSPLKTVAEGLFIRLPYDVLELRKEGEVLHHCVGTYIEKVAKGETTILFIRKVEEPNKPYYTMEFKDNHIVQCRGFHNCSMTKEVEMFADLFEKRMNEGQKKRKKVN